MTGGGAAGPAPGERATADAVTVLIVDDHAMVRRGVQDFLATQPGITVLAEASSSAEAIAAAAECAPDVALVDLVMPGTEGVELIRRLGAASPRTRLVVLTSFHDDRHLFPALRAGAQSYLLKDIGPSELAAAVRKAAAGEVVLSPLVAARVIAEMGDPGSRRVLGDLTAREVEVLRLVADGLSNSDIAGRLFIAERTVKSHVSNILAKLHLADRTQAAVLAWRRGIAGP